MSDSDIDGGPEPVAPAVRRGAYQVSLVGRYRIFLIISSAIGLWASYFDHFPDLYGTEHEYVVGFALARYGNSGQAQTHPQIPIMSLCKGLHLGSASRCITCVVSYSIQY